MKLFSELLVSVLENSSFESFIPMFPLLWKMMPLCLILQKINEDENNLVNIIGWKAAGGLSDPLKLEAQTGIFPCLVMKDSFLNGSAIHSSSSQGHNALVTCPGCHTAFTL